MLNPVFRAASQSSSPARTPLEVKYSSSNAGELAITSVMFGVIVSFVCTASSSCFALSLVAILVLITGTLFIPSPIDAFFVGNHQMAPHRSCAQPSSSYAEGRRTPVQSIGAIMSGLMRSRSANINRRAGGDERALQDW